MFIPDPEQYYSRPITIIVMSRLVYRKGADLLVEVIPEVCRRHPTVHFVVAGDGPKRVPIEEMREKNKLHMRCQMIGMLPHNKVRDLLVRGQIFLNTSLTEAFCTSIVEAASCGLHIVSTRVGGVPEVLPDDFVTLADPTSESKFVSNVLYNEFLFTGIVESLLYSIRKIEAEELISPTDRHTRMSPMYRWPSVAERTEKVYYSVIKDEPLSLKGRIENYSRCGIVFGVFWIWFTIINLIVIAFIDIFDSKTKTNRVKKTK